jgi:hypothetical protein
VVYAIVGRNLWITTSRASVKVRAWKRDPRVGGLVRAGEMAVSFSGRVRRHDLLDPSTWASSMKAAPEITVAAARFTARNARFFAGYAVDARHVPLSWTPPGRVFAALEMSTVSHLDLSEGIVVDPEAGLSGAPPGPRTRNGYRAVRATWDALDAVPGRIAERVGRSGQATLAVAGEHGPRVLPATWAWSDGVLLTAFPVAFLPLLDLAGADVPVGVTVDHASAWRAREMTGVLFRGPGSLFLPNRLRNGGSAAARAIEETGANPGRSVLVRVRPEQAVWWEGWGSGTVLPP